MDTRDVIKHVPFFKNLREEDLADLERIVKIQTHRANSVLFRTGDPPDSFFIIVVGQVEKVSRYQRRSARWVSSRGGSKGAVAGRPPSGLKRVNVIGPSSLGAVKPADSSRMVSGSGSASGTGA